MNVDMFPPFQRAMPNCGGGIDGPRARPAAGAGVANPVSPSVSRPSVTRWVRLLGWRCGPLAPKNWESSTDEIDIELPTKRGSTLHFVRVLRTKTS